MFCLSFFNVLNLLIFFVNLLLSLGSFFIFIFFIFILKVVFLLVREGF